ncbi:hypothetical protein ASG35_26830 [Burkholderia sp. Leaf177]|nr:hypothetical protein ASG35_26830 [Burkholderia sp. Leaf177]
MGDQRPSGPETASLQFLFPMHGSVAHSRFTYLFQLNKRRLGSPGEKNQRGFEGDALPIARKITNMHDDLTECSFVVQV